MVAGTGSIWLSIFGNDAAGVRAGSGRLPLLLDATAVVLTMSGQSLIPLGVVENDPLEAVVNASLRFAGLLFLTGCFAVAGFLQQLCAAAGSQLSPSTTVSLDSTVSAAFACMLLQPNRHPPAIHTDTIKARRTRGTLMNKADFTGSSLLRKTQKHKDLASVM